MENEARTLNEAFGHLNAARRQIRQLARIWQKRANHLLADGAIGCAADLDYIVERMEPMMRETSPD